MGETSLTTGWNHTPDSRTPSSEQSPTTQQYGLGRPLVPDDFLCFCGSRCIDLTDLDLTDLDLTDLCETRQISASTAVLVGYPKSSLALRPTRNAVKAALVLIVFAVSAFALAIAQDQAAITAAEAPAAPRPSNSALSKTQPSIPHPSPKPAKRWCT
jgi:hypothetical protein